VLYLPPMELSFAELVAVPAHQEEPMFAVEEDKEVREVKAQSAQGIAWPPPRRSGGLLCRPLAQTRAILSPPGGFVKINREKFTLKFSLE
jgi:hypothetical protein